MSIFINNIDERDSVTYIRCLRNKKCNWCYVTSQIMGDSNLFRLIVYVADIKVKYDLILWGHTTTKCMTLLVSTLISY